MSDAADAGGGELGDVRKVFRFARLKTLNDDLRELQVAEVLDGRALGVLAKVEFRDDAGGNETGDGVDAVGVGDRVDGVGGLIAQSSMDCRVSGVEAGCDGAPRVAARCLVHPVVNRFHATNGTGINRVSAFSPAWIVHKPPRLGVAGLQPRRCGSL